MTTAEDQLLTSIVAAARERLGAAACSVALLDGPELVFRAADGAGAEAVVGVRLPLGRGIAGYVVASGQALAVADVRADRRFDADTAQSTGYVPTTILAVPVEDEEDANGDGAVGVLEVLDRDPGPRDLEVAAAAARQVALVRALTARQAAVADLVADPAMAALVDLLRALARATDRDRALAAGLLRTVLDARG